MRKLRHRAIKELAHVSMQLPSENGTRDLGFMHFHKSSRLLKLNSSKNQPFFPHYLQVGLHVVFEKGKAAAPHCACTGNRGPPPHPRTNTHRAVKY